MNREQAINYLRSSGFSEEQISSVVGAFTCKDAVSREFMYKLGAKCIAARDENGELVAIASIESLPSVTPEIPTSADCVSRKAVLETLRKSWLSGTVAHRIIDDIGDKIRMLPSVTPERPKGKWIIDDDKDEWYTYVHTCPFCNWEQVGGNFCTNCGADMRGAQK